MKSSDFPERFVRPGLKAYQDLGSRDLIKIPRRLKATITGGSLCTLSGTAIRPSLLSLSRGSIARELKSVDVSPNWRTERQRLRRYL
jgi:hypothetical protein